MKKGYQTSEFWISMVVVLVGAVQASGLIDDNDSAMKIVGLIAAMLGGLGYTVPRMALKQAEIKASAVTAVASSEAIKASVVNPTK